MTTNTRPLNRSQMRLYTTQNRRLYINASERQRFLRACETASPTIRAFCLTMVFSGCRLSEARELTRYAVQAREGLIAIRSLKKRNQHVVREVPVPPVLINALFSLNDPMLWHVNRSTAYRWVKSLMAEADIIGPQATPKGLRHGFGIHAVKSGIQLNMIQKWMGHASIQTTAIYSNAVGKEERELAAKMWGSET